MLDGAVLADMLRPVRSTSAELLLPDLERKYSFVTQKLREN